MDNKARQGQEKQQITVMLYGPDVRRFRNFKKNQRLRADAEAARKLMLERLTEIEEKAA